MTTPPKNNNAWLAEPWDILSTEHLLQNPFLCVRRERVRVPTGEEADYYINEREGWAAVFGVTPEGKVVLNRQYKHGVRRVITELPAGSIDPGESPEEAARREFLEETGYEAGDLEFIARYAIDPTSCDGFMYLYYANPVRRVGPRTSTDPLERIENILVDVSDLRTMIGSGEIDAMGQVAAILTVLGKKHA